MGISGHPAVQVGQCWGVAIVAHLATVATAVVPSIHLLSVDKCQVCL